MLVASSSRSAAPTPPPAPWPSTRSELGCSARSTNNLPGPCGVSTASTVEVMIRSASPDQVLVLARLGGERLDERGIVVLNAVDVGGDRVRLEGSCLGDRKKLQRIASDR